MSSTGQALVVASAVLLLQAATQGQTPQQTADALARSAETALAGGRYREAVQACAEALSRFPDEAASHACAKKVEPNLKDVVSAGAARLAAGDAEGALKRCAAVLVVSPTDKEASTCVTTARTQIASHDRDKLKLEQARGYFAAGDHARASQNLGELGKSEFPDILNGSVELQDALNRKTTAQVDLTARAAIEHAKLFVEYGKQDEAVKMLHDVLTSNASPFVRDEALRALSDARPSLRRAYLESLRHPWAVQVLAMLSFIAGVWIGLHWVRDLWRWIDARFITGARGRWKFAGINDDAPLGARDPILDALRRVPHEVHKPIWTPTRLTLYPYYGGWDVWEDFCIADSEKATVVHEPVFDMSVRQSGGDSVLSDAFQNLQFTVGNVGVGAVTKFWTGLVEWWHTGEPSFSATCQDVTGPDGAHVVIRLSSTGPAGTASVLATHDRQNGLDVLSLCAERAAYKLLFTMSDYPDSAAQIDGHAAFRQGVTSLSRSVRAIVDTKINKEERERSIFTGICNLEEARRSFERDGDHRVYHLQSLRFLGIAYALVGRDVAARTILEELEDAADKPTPAQKEADRKRNQQLKVEAQFNQAMLYCHMVAEEGDEARASLLRSEEMTA
jgi:tetratricopeptide (TPR) repeat protein